MSPKAFSPSARRVSAALAISLWCLAELAPAHAAASLVTARGTDVLQEAQLMHDVELVGAVAVVESTQVIANPTQAEQQAVYTFELPAEAAVVDARVRLPNGHTTTAAIVDSDAGLAAIPEPTGVDAAPDTALLRLVSRDVPTIDRSSPYVSARYELRIYPVLPGMVTTVVTRWMVPLRYDDGRLSLVIPHRGDAGNLVRERVSLRLSPPPGARGFLAVHGGGKLLGKQITSAQFTAPPHGDLVIDAIPDFGAGAASPVVSYAAVPLRSDLGALAVSVMSPLPSRSQALHYDTALLLVDVSQSMGADGVAAAAELADALLGSLPPEVKVEAILFDHDATRVFSSFTGNGHQARKDLAKALRPSELRNGSDLGQALEVARRALKEQGIKAPEVASRRKERPSTLVAIISDGMTPIGLDSRKAMDHLGDDLLESVEIFSMVLVPDSAAVPDIHGSVLGRLASKTEGRVIAVRFAEAPSRARNLASELSRPAPLRDLDIEIGGTTVPGLALPAMLDAGQGFVATSFYRGAGPRRLALVATRHDSTLRMDASRDPGLIRAALPLALIRAIPEQLVPDGEMAPTAAEIEDGRRALVRAARQASVVTRYSALVAVDSKDPFAQDRLALTKKWGPTVYFRLPPPPEREPGYELRHYEETRATAQAGQASTRTGELDRTIIRRLITTHVVPQARACYEKHLRRDTRLTGSMTVVVEIVRGEVQHARIEGSTFASIEIERCVTQAAYSIQVPRVALGQDQEIISLVRYPLVFQQRNGSGYVSEGKDSRPAGPAGIDSKEPLGGADEP